MSRDVSSRGPHAGMTALWLGIGIWLLVMALTWPQALSFADDVGYVGQAKVLLDGRVLAHAEDAGIWIPTEVGAVSKYPLLASLLMAPLLAITPRAVFALGILSAIAACLIGARVLKAWGTEPVWALLLLAHPTIVIIARTATADVPLTALALGGWWALRQNRRAATIALFAAMFALKPTGFLLGGALAGGEWLRTFPELRRGEPDARRRLVTSLVAIAAGFAMIFAMNLISARRLWFAYDFRALGIQPFSLTHFKTTAPLQLRSVLLFPPLLLLGAWTYWRRRELGPLCLIVGFGGLMCFYFFVDSGVTLAESLVLAPRLVLPMIGFLLLGYADLLAGAFRRLTGPAPRRSLAAVLVGGTAIVVAGVSVKHSRWQGPMADARHAAERIVQQQGARELGMAPQAAKAGLLFAGPTPIVSVAEATVPVVLCSGRSASHRAPNDGGDYSCSAPGYRSDDHVGDFEVLVRRDRWTPGEK